MFIGGGIGPFKHPPVHESLTLAALITSNFRLDPSTTYSKAIKKHDCDTLEFLRGTVWNDDPGNLLFDDAPGDNSPKNFSKGTGKDWALQYLHYKLSNAERTKNGSQSKNVVARSHFGDLQFLHAMASDVGEIPEDTKGKMMLWIEAMYKVATGVIDPDAILNDVELPYKLEDDRYPFRRFFNENTTPRIDETITTLLTSDHPFEDVKLDRRALGSCLHIIQDSYARGHCQRRIEREDTPLRFGDILNFHSFEGQDQDAHSKYDFADSELEDVNCADPNTFTDMDGCTDAIGKCVMLINFWYNGTAWENGVSSWLERDVFRISWEATPSNTRVD